MHMTLESAALIVIRCEGIECLEELVQVDEGADHDERSEDVPQPVVGGGEQTVIATPLQFVADAVGDVVEPHHPCDAAGEPSEEEQHEKVMHALPSVVAARDDVDGVGGFGHHHDVVDSQRDEAEENVFEEAPVGGARRDGRLVVRVGHPSRIAVAPVIRNLLIVLVRPVGVLRCW